MAQNLNLSVSGLYTSQSDFNGIPPGALDVADNVESRYKNTLEPRRGFDTVPNSAIDLEHFIRLTNFYVAGVNSLIGLTDTFDLLYYDGVTPWVAIPGVVSTGIQPPDSINGKSRFLVGGSNLYLTAQDGIRSLASGSGSQMYRAGVPKALDIQAVATNDSSGFFNNNVIATTTGTVTNASALITNLSSTTQIAVGQFISGVAIPAGTTVLSIAQPSAIVIQTGDTTATSAVITNLASLSGISAGTLVSGDGVPTGSYVISTATGPNRVTLNGNVFLTATGTLFTFTAPAVVTMSANATGNHTAETILFYTGAEVAYRLLYGRVETNINGVKTTRLGSPSTSVICTNTSATSTNASITATLPKNSEGRITFVQLYRSPQTPSVNVTPLDQYNLVYEADLLHSDFVARTITITDDVPDSLVGIPLYTGADQEGILQSNDPPPMSWDICKFRDFLLYANVTYPTTQKVTLVGVGSPSGLQNGDIITISGNFLGVPFTETYTAAGSEVAASRQFKVSTGGSPSQNISDTTLSLIRVINYDEALPVHVILLSSAVDLPGQMLFEADNPSYDTFSIIATGHPAAFDPDLTSAVASAVNTIQNGIAVSKSGELEGVPGTNLFQAGDSSSPVLRLIALRDYVIVLKSDGIYKVLGLTPPTLVINPFDLTTKIIGADTAVSLNSGVWMLSNQGVVSIDDGGVSAKSIPIDDQLNVLIGSYLTNLITQSFAIGYESDRKYILSVPTGNDPATQIQYVFNYVTSAWTTWSRELYFGYVNSLENKVYISRSDGGEKFVSSERKSATYQDYVDEGTDNTVISVSGVLITLDNVSGIGIGDILYQDATHFSPILSVDLVNSIITVQYSLSFVPGDCSILHAYLCTMTWKQVFADNPAFVRQYSEGVALFKNTRFNTATASFVTDFSQNEDLVTLTGTGNAFWGLFPWGGVPWGGSILPSKIRFYIPQNKQLGSYLLPTLKIQQGYSNFKFDGLAIAYSPVSQEVGL